MALVTFSGLVSDVKGSVGGIVFQGGANGSIVRRRSIPVNRNTSAQQRERLNLATYSGKWRALDESDRQAWIDATPLYPYTNKMGDTLFYTGFQLYMKTNLNLELAAFSI